MSQSIFAPQSTKEDPVTSTNEAVAQTQPQEIDQTSAGLLSIARWTFVGFAALLPLFFIPGLWGSLGFQKVLLASGVVGVVLIVLSLLMLRVRSVSSVVPVPLMLFWGVVLTAVMSALFSPNWLTAFRGVGVESQTVLFLVVMGGIMTSALVMQEAKQATFRLFLGLLLSAALLLVYVITRLFFGPILAFGSFAAVTTSPLGNFNDVAVFAGLIILLSLITMVQLQLTKLLQVIVMGIVTLALVVLAVVNFFYVWLAIGFFGLLILLYLVTRDTIFALEDTTSKSKVTSIPKLVFVTTALVCAVSGGFILANDYVGSYVSSVFAVEYLEVRPSLGATVDIMQSVYAQDALFGAGPNQFISAWRLYKDPAINQTIFWNIDFPAGSGYIPTLFINLGIIGTIAILLFQVWFVVQGIKSLLRPINPDAFWLYIGLISFSGAVFLWFISYIYIPGVTLLLLTALLTGLSLAAGRSLQPNRTRSITLVINRQRGFMLMALAVICITGTMGTWFILGKQYTAQASYAQTEATSTDLSVIDQAAFESYGLYPHHRFLGIRAQIALLEMNQLLSIAEPTEADQQRFLDVSNRAVTFAEAAIASAPTEPAYYSILATVYNNLAIAGVTDAIERATTSVATAIANDPRNPAHLLVMAQLAANRGDIEASRSALSQSLQLKRNFSQSLHLLAQLDIAEGNVEAAIRTTEAIISLEPTNPTRYYQLGILETANGNIARAQQAYEAALQIDPAFANARYLLSLILVEQGTVELALEYLRMIADSNPDNQELQALINALESGNIPAVSAATAEPVAENTPVVSEDGVTSPVVPDSDLLTPLNSVSQSENDTSELAELSSESVESDDTTNEAVTEDTNGSQQQ